MNEQLPVTSAISSDKSIMENRPFTTTLADSATGALVYSTNPILQAARQRQRELFKRIARDNKDRLGWSTAELTVFEERIDSNLTKQCPTSASDLPCKSVMLGVTNDTILPNDAHSPRISSTHSANSAGSAMISALSRFSSRSVFVGSGLSTLSGGRGGGARRGARETRRPRRTATRARGDSPRAARPAQLEGARGQGARGVASLRSGRTGAGPPAQEPGGLGRRVWWAQAWRVARLGVPAQARRTSLR